MLFSVVPPTPSSTYKGLVVRVVLYGETGFGYEIRRGRRALTCSQDVFVTPDAAFAAAQQFIDEVDRRMGLKPEEG